MSKGPDRLTRRATARIRRCLVLCCAVATILVASSVSTCLAQTIASYEQNLATLKKMDDSQKRLLRDRYETFKKLDEREREELLKKHKKIHGRPDAARLQQVMERYYEWFANQKPGVQDKLRKLPPEERAAETMKRYQSQQIARERDHFRRRLGKSLQGLKESDLEAMRAWHKKFLQSHEEEMFELLSPESQQNIDAPQKETRHPPREIRILMALHHEEQSFPPTKKELDTLRESLSEQGAKRLLDDPDQASQWKRLQRAIRDAWLKQMFRGRRPEFNRKAPSEAELQSFYFNTLDEDERSFLESLPAGEMRRELRNLFIARNDIRPRRPRPGNGVGRRPGDGRGRRPEGRSGPPDRSRGDRGRGPRPPRHQDTDR